MPVENIGAALEALEADDTKKVLECLENIRKAVREPLALRLALNSKLEDLCQKCLSSGYVKLRREALLIYADSLLSFKDNELAADNYELVKDLLAFFKAEVLRDASRSDLFKEALDALTQWCSYGKAFRETFLVVYPVEYLKDFDVYHMPSTVLMSYVRLMRAILLQGRSRSPLFETVLNIYKKTLSYTGVTCEMVIEICGSFKGAAVEFEREDFFGVILSSRLADTLVRHVMTNVNCQRKCLNPMLALFVDCLASSNNHCKELIDQGILNVLLACLKENQSKDVELTCRALTNIFACSHEVLDHALRADLAKPLLFLRESFDERIREESHRALSNLFARATPRQIFSLVEIGCVALLANLLRSRIPDVVLDGLRALFALVSATRLHDPLKLTELHRQMEANGVKTLSESLKLHEQTEIRSLATGIYNYMAFTLDSSNGPADEKTVISKA
ncbi:uncharacterized protein LOC100903652 [Galendromus occidentalis]|uniref:Uncharacterized protein LOC100903652 n=1 Tax=Galendromus occidentalis TaxID=34638 RepID=A0AAJ6QSN5_9ACAR|nr:uncharacterized protein LOC100903652 [Galendromus occidentalis]